MQLSKFNVMTKYNNTLLIFNSLKGTFLQLNNEKDIDLILNLKLNELHPAQINRLMDFGVVIDNQSEENILAQKKLLDYVYDSKLELVIMPTMQCNFRCSYCYEDFQMGTINESGVESIIKYLRSTLSHHSGLVIDWFGGEPLLALEQMEHITAAALKYCSKLRIPYYSNITTNGYLLTPENIHRLLKMRIYDMQITIDGSEEFHNKNRFLINGKPTFQRIISNLLYIKHNIKCPALQISIRCNLSKSSLSDIPNFMNQLNEWFGDDKRFHFYFHPIEDWGGDKVKKFQDDLLNGADLFFETLLKYQSKIRIENYFKKLSYMPVCNTVKVNRFIIDPELNVYKCSLYRKEPRNMIGKLENGTMHLDQKKIAYWSLETISDYDVCKNDCPRYANCFAKLCPYKMNSHTRFKCIDSINKVSKLLEIDYKFSSEKYIEI